MKHFCSFRLPLLLLFSALIFSCASREKMAYYQNIDSIVKNDSSSSYEAVLEADDQIKIVVMAENQEVASPFNVSRMDSKSGVNSPGQETNIYLIDSQGFIQFPLIGKIKLGGLTKSQAINEMESVLRQYINKSPAVTISILNYKITVQGEVANPGTYNIQSERVTLPEALAMAGDLTIFGKRNNVMIVRDKSGKKTVERVDITKADFVNSPYYYLAQNDLIYVEPNKVKMNSSKTDQNIGIIFSSLSIIIAIIVLITK